MTGSKHLKLATHTADVDATHDEPPPDECKKMFVHYATEFFRNEMHRIRKAVEMGGAPEMARLIPHTEHEVRVINELRVWGERWDRAERPAWWAGYDSAREAAASRIAEIERQLAGANTNPDDTEEAP